MDLEDLPGLAFRSGFGPKSRKARDSTWITIEKFLMKERQTNILLTYCDAFGMRGPYNTLRHQGVRFGGRHDGELVKQATTARFPAEQ